MTPDQSEFHSGTLDQISAGADGTVDLGSAIGEGPPAFQTRPYDPSKDRESIRGWIALSLIGTLAGVFVASFAFFWVHPDRSKDLHDLLGLILGPLIALVGAATGYYFGSEAARK